MEEKQLEKILAEKIISGAKPDPNERNVIQAKCKILSPNEVMCHLWTPKMQGVNGIKNCSSCFYLQSPKNDEPYCSRRLNFVPSNMYIQPKK